LPKAQSRSVILQQCEGENDNEILSAAARHHASSAHDMKVEPRASQKLVILGSPLAMAITMVAATGEITFGHWLPVLIASLAAIGLVLRPEVWRP